MAREQLGHRARDGLRQPGDQQRQLSPTVCVELEVSFSDEQAKRYLHDVNEELRRRLGPRRKAFHLIRPDKMRVSVISPRLLDDKIRIGHKRPTTRDMRELALSFGDRIEGLLRDNRDRLAFPVGQVALYSNDGLPSRVRPIRQVVGVEIEGWGGPKTRLATRDQEGNLLAAGFLSDMNLACLETVARQYPHIDPLSLRRSPRVHILERSAPILDHEFRKIRDALRQALPEEITLGAPIISVHNTNPPIDDIRIPIGSDFLAANG